MCKTLLREGGGVDSRRGRSFVTDGVVNSHAVLVAAETLTGTTDSICNLEVRVNSFMTDQKEHIYIAE